MKKHGLYLGIAACTMALPLGIQAQEEVEELIVTGSYIKRDKFELASPVEVLTGEDIQTSGYTSIGSYIRDLTFTANVDTVANVLSVDDGGQDSNSARFNLRGLGTSSTLTLFDGRRVLNSGAVAGILPDIAMERAEVILDGGAATYGTDAVAGVVNIVPLKDYEGFKVRGFYTRDGEGDTYEPKLSMLWGKNVGKLDVVAAIEYSERPDALYRSDRPEYLRADSDSSTSGNPGSFTGNLSASPFLPFAIDPECGVANTGNTDDGLQGAYPSGIPAIPVSIVPAAACTFEYGAYQDYKRPNEDLIVYIGTTFEVSDSLSLEFLLNHNDRTSTLISSPSTAERGSNDLLTIATTHPNNPYGTVVTPRSWRPFSQNGATQPSHLDDHGSDNNDFNYVTTSVALGAEFALGGTWTGETFLTKASTTTDISGYAINLDRLTMAMAGTGGVNGNQRFNPFFSASPFSPSYNGCETGTAAGCTANDQGLVNWLYQKFDYESSKTDYWSVEGFVTGDLFEMPSGAAQIAIGAQFRETEFTTIGNPFNQTPSAIHTTASGTGGPASLDYNSAVVNGISTRTNTESAVASVFTELLVPFTSNFEMTIAARYEDFKDLDLSAAVPKVSFRYQPTDTLALRASYGEGFLAPTVTEVTVDPTPGCAELFTGNDPVLGGSIVGSLSCTNGNPLLDPEESSIVNVGATWKATEELELSLDYQQIDYTDRIIRLSSTDRLNLDLANFLSANGISKAAWDALSTTAKRTAFLPWIGSPGEDPNITRSATNGAVQQVVRLPGNVAEVEVDVVDFRIRYGTELGDFGYLSANWSTTWYSKYEYVDAFATTVDAAGLQNGDSDIAPPLPELKHQLRVGWLNEGHFVGLTFNHQSDVEFDATIGPGFVPGVGYTGDTNGFGTEVAPATIHGQTIVDFRYAYTFEELMNGRLELAAGSNNVLNKKAQALPVVGGLETRLQDPTGRTYYLEATYSFE